MLFQQLVCLHADAMHPSKPLFYEEMLYEEMPTGKEDRAASIITTPAHAKAVKSALAKATSFDDPRLLQGSQSFHGQHVSDIFLPTICIADHTMIQGLAQNLRSTRVNKVQL